MLIIFICCIAFLFSIISMASFSAHEAVYYMILTFLATGIVYYLLGSQYVSMMLFIVYVGAVAMLFVFCVMLLNLMNFAAYDNLKFMAYGYLLSLVLTAALAAVDIANFIIPDQEITEFITEEFLRAQIYSKNFQLLAMVFTDFVFDVMVIGVILFFVTVVVTHLIDNTNTKKKLLIITNFIYTQTCLLFFLV